jgi:hypothetical protein
MSTTYTTSQAALQFQPIDSAEAGDVVSVRGEFSLAAALVVNDIIEMGWLPANCVPVDVIVDTDDLDTGTAAVLEAGIVGDPFRGTAADTTDTNAFIDASTVGQAGGIARMNVVTGPRLASVSRPRRFGIKVATAPTTSATTGKIGMTLLYRPKLKGE